MITVQNLTKTFRIAKRESGLKNAAKALFHREYTVVQALRGISFHMDAGEIAGYIGPNGAGKSTTIKILCGILSPDSGVCTVDGRVPWKERKQHVQNIGVVFGQRSQLWWDIPVGDSFDLLRDIYRIEDSAYRQTKGELVDILSLSQLLLTPVRQLSLGQRMRCEIAAALLHNPKVLFLDEPTIGLDAVSKLAVREFIKSINQSRNVTVILTTHDMSDIEALTNRILLIGKGAVLRDSTLEETRRRYSTEKYITIKGAKPPDGISGIPGVQIADAAQESALRLKVDLSKATVSQVIAVCSRQMEIQDMEIEEESVDDIIVKLYKELGI